MEAGRLGAVREATILTVREEAGQRPISGLSGPPHMSKGPLEAY